jgi:hypothetical protein
MEEVIAHSKADCYKKMHEWIMAWEYLFYPLGYVMDAFVTPITASHNAGQKRKAIDDQTTPLLMLAGNKDILETIVRHTL